MLHIFHVTEMGSFCDCHANRPDNAFLALLYCDAAKRKKKVLHRQLSIGYGQPLCNCLMVSSSWVMNGKEPAWAAAIHREPQWRENKQTCWFTLRKWILLLFFCTCVVVLTREVTVQLRLDPLGVQVDNWFQLMLTRLRIVYKTASERSWAAGLGFADANKSKLTRIKASI